MAYVVDRIVDYYLYPTVEKQDSAVYPTYNVGGTECLIITRDDATSWMVYCHGNAVTLKDLYSSGVAEDISNKCKCNFVAPAYPDTCLSGLNHDAAIVTAVQAAYERICDDHGDQVYVAGRSLGVGVALAACCDRPPRGFLLLSGFSSLFNMMPRIIPRCLVSKRYANDDMIGLPCYEHVPKLIVHGTNDSVVPVHNANALAAAAQNTRLCIVNGMSHTPDSHWQNVYTLFTDFISNDKTAVFHNHQYPLWKC